MGQKPKSPDPR